MIIIITDWPKSLLGDCDLKYNYAIYSLLRKDFEPFPDWGEDIRWDRNRGKLWKWGHRSIKTLCWCLLTHPPHKPNELEWNILKPSCVYKCLVQWCKQIPHNCNQMTDRTLIISSTGYVTIKTLCMRNDGQVKSFHMILVTARHMIKSVSWKQLNYSIDYCYFTEMHNYILNELNPALIQ